MKTDSPPTPSTYLLLLAVAALPYLTALHHDFVYDDHGQIVENPYLRNPARVPELLTLQTLNDAHVVNGRRPVVLLSYLVDRALWGAHAFGFHLTNLALHLATTLLFYGLLRNLARHDHPGAPGEFLALAASLVYAAHPVLTETVHLPSFRPDVLYPLFVVAYLLLAQSLVEVYGLSWLARVAGATLAFGVALGSKEAGLIALPAAMCMWLCFPSTRPRGGTVSLLMLLGLGVVALFALLSIGGAPAQATGEVWNGLSLAPPANLYTGAWLWVRYLGLLAWPHPLIVDRVVEPVPAPWDIRFVAGLTVLALSIAAFFIFRRKQPWVSFGLAWMLLGFAPVSNLVPLFNPMAERYMYFMVMGFGILVALALTRLRIGPNVLAALCMVFMVTSTVRLRDWRSDAVLWSRTARDEPRSARARAWVGLDLKAKGRIDEAYNAFKEADRLNPQNISGLVNMAIIHGQRGDLGTAEILLREAVKRRPDDPGGYWNLAFDLQLQDRPNEALEVLQECLRVNPLHLRARDVITDRLIDDTQYGEAMAMVVETLDIDPAHTHALEARAFLNHQVR